MHPRGKKRKKKAEEEKGGKEKRKRNGQAGPLPNPLLTAALLWFFKKISNELEVVCRISERTPRLGISSAMDRGKLGTISDSVFVSCRLSSDGEWLCWAWLKTVGIGVIGSCVHGPGFAKRLALARWFGWALWGAFVWLEDVYRVGGRTNGGANSYGRRFWALAGRRRFSTGRAGMAGRGPEVSMVVEASGVEVARLTMARHRRAALVAVFHGGGHGLGGFH